MNLLHFPIRLNSTEMTCLKGVIITVELVVIISHSLRFYNSNFADFYETEFVFSPGIRNV